LGQMNVTDRVKGIFLDRVGFGEDLTVYTEKELSRMYKLSVDYIKESLDFVMDEVGRLLDSSKGHDVRSGSYVPLSSRLSLDESLNQVNS